MKQEEKTISASQLNKRTIISFVVFALFFVGCIFAWKWLQQQPKDQGALKPLRSVLNTNEAIFSSIFSSEHLARTFKKKYAAPRVRVNGDAGMSKNFDTASWKLKVVKNAGDTLLLGLEDIRKLPRTELIFNFKCIEGWSQVSYWAGVKFSDFVKHYGLSNQATLAYAGLMTPDKGYYVGIDMESMMHPQTLLCYEMNGAPLPMNQGYPLRLIIPVKYGIKHLKRIGTLFFSNNRPADYWAQRGYDYYSGL